MKLFLFLVLTLAAFARGSGLLSTFLEELLAESLAEKQLANHYEFTGTGEAHPKPTGTKCPNGYKIQRKSYCAKGTDGFRGVCTEWKVGYICRRDDEFHECARRNKRVMTESECRALGRSSGYRWDRTFDRWNWPYGCITTPNRRGYRNVYFNDADRTPDNNIVDFPKQSQSARIVCKDKN